MGIVNIPFWEVIDMLCNHSTEKLLGLKGVIVKILTFTLLKLRFETI